MAEYKKTYHPINCSFHDILLEKATFRKIVDLIYYSVEGVQEQSSNVIKDVFTKSGAEYLLLDDGKLIRLDHIVSVDDILLPKNQCNI